MGLEFQKTLSDLLELELELEMLGFINKLNLPKNIHWYLYSFSIFFIRRSLDKSTKSIKSDYKHNEIQGNNKQKKLFLRFFYGSYNFLNEVLVAETIQTIRKAFIIQAYHTWEKTVCRCYLEIFPVDNSLRSFKNILQAAKSMGFDVHPEINLVSDLANFLKHDSSSSAKRLLLEWPELFHLNHKDSEQIPEGEGISWTPSIRINDEWVQKIFSILEKSTPPKNKVDCKQIKNDTKLIKRR